MNAIEKEFNELAVELQRELDAIYGYGITEDPTAFGFISSKYVAKEVLIAILGKTMTLTSVHEHDIEYLAEAVHDGWSLAVSACPAPDAAKQAKRMVLANADYRNLSEEEKEKDRVLARYLAKRWANI